MKTCKVCGEAKETAEFYFLRNKPIPSCKVCVRAKLAARHDANKNLPEYRAQRIAQYRRRVYGIVEAEYKRLIEQSGGACAICGVTSKMMLDHDHITG